MKAVFLLSSVATAADVDCASTSCPSKCNCVETNCNSMYTSCTGDSQCNGIMNCLMSCSCDDIVCGLGCVAGKSLDTVSSKVETCSKQCASDIYQKWGQFKKDFGKVYLSDDDEAMRFELFKESTERVAKLNELNGQPAFGINFMSDRLAHEKFKTGHVKPDGFVATAPVKQYEPRNVDSIDWHLTEAITSIKNQGQCGSCWAFSATEAVESQLVLSSGGSFAIELSPQQITSCTPSTGTYGCDGCNGGFTEGAYEYLKGTVGLANSFFYPYAQSLTASSATAACDTAKVTAIDGADAVLQGGYAKVTGYHYATAACTSGACTNQNLGDLKSALESTPVSICVNAGTWNDYTTGVMTSAACGSMAAADQDHCVMATGFNATAPTPYWIVRNSWSSTWGMDGYIHLELSKNTCGLADDATIPEVSLGLSDEQMAEAIVQRELMFQRASQNRQTVV